MSQEATFSIFRGYRIKTKLGALTAALVLAVAGSAQAQWASRSSSPYGHLTVTKLISMPNSRAHTDWINAINAAQSSIHMTMYHMTDKSVINALIQKAQNSSVDIRIIVDGKSLKGGYAKAIQSLTSAGVNVRGSSSAFSLTHSKDMVIDGQEAFIGAVDLTNTWKNMRDFTVVTPDQRAISEVERVFEADWSNAANQTAVTPPVSDPNLVWSPTNSQTKLVDLINSATTSIVAETENFDETHIIAALNQAAARGVNVRLITPECSFGNAQLNYQGFSQLQGVQVHVEHDGDSPAQPYMHSKMMVVDGRVVFVGSQNLSFNSIRKDRELGLIFSNSRTASQLSSAFETDWNRSQAPSANPNCKASTWSFDPFSSTQL